MKKQLITITFLLAARLAALAHGDIEFGPKGGRLIEFSPKDGLHAEVVLKDEKFEISLYDEKQKTTVPAGDKVLTVTSGDRNNPAKLPVEKSGEGFSLAKPAGDDFWLILQVRAGSGKPQTARLHYEAKICPECKKAEWLCSCKD